MSGLRKQIKDYNAVATPAGNDKIPAQQTADNVVRYMTPLQIINLYATTFGKSLIDDADATAGRNTLAALGTGDLATQADVETGTDNAKWISSLRTKQGVSYYLLNDAAIKQSVADIVPAYTDLASAATTELDSVSSLYINITGTTGITSFGTATDGLYRYLKFADSLTITNGASLVCPSNADIITQAGDTLLAVCGASNVWTI